MKDGLYEDKDYVDTEREDGTEGPRVPKAWFEKGNEQLLEPGLKKKSRSRRSSSSKDDGSGDDDGSDS